MSCKFEILCVTMHQTDFSKIREMNIHSNVVFANQADSTHYQELQFEGRTARMITTSTRGVGINRNLALMYAKGDICLFADDDVKYIDELESVVLSEFNEHPDADIFIFHLETDDAARPQKKYPKTRKCGLFEKMPWGGFRIAVRLNSVKKSNVYFSTLFGGGATFPSGEDSKWLSDAKRKGLKFYVSNQTIGQVSFEQSSWFTGHDEKFYYAKGCYLQSEHPNTVWLWMLYYACRCRNHKELSFYQKIRWMLHGRMGYVEMKRFEEYKMEL